MSEREADTRVPEEAVRAAQKAFESIDMLLKCGRCEGTGIAIVGEGAFAGGDTCPDCGGGGYVMPEGYDPTRAALEAALPFLSPQAGEARVEDHKWFDPKCHESGCQSLVLRHRIVDLIAAGNKLSFAAQTTGGTAGRDDGLVAAIEQWTNCRDASSSSPGIERALIELARRASPRPIGDEKAREAVARNDVLEEAALAIEATDERSELAKREGYEPEWHKARKLYARIVRALKVMPATPEEK